MASHSLVVLFAAMLLIGLATGSGSKSHTSPSPSPSPEDMSPKQQRERLRCRIALRKARKELRCALLRISLRRRLKNARKCRYADMSFSKYRKIRTTCKKRSESLTRLRAARKKCRMAGISVRSGYRKGKMEEEEEEEPVDVSGITCGMYDELLAARLKAVRACKRIGWVGGRARSKKCEKIKPLKYKLHDLRKSNCGEGGVEEAQKELMKIKRRCRGTGGIVTSPPSNAPREPR